MITLSPIKKANISRSVGRVDRSGSIAKGIERPHSHQIYEPFGFFFQTSFVDAIKRSGVATPEELAIIEKMKPLRNTFKELTAEIINYCKFECMLLARMMERFSRDVSRGRLRPAEKWCSGPGWIAAEMFRKHGIPKRPLTARERDVQQQREREAEERRKLKGKPRRASRGGREPGSRPERDPELEKAICAALYGGRFEVGTIRTYFWTGLSIRQAQRLHPSEHALAALPVSRILGNTYPVRGTSPRSEDLPREDRIRAPAQHPLLWSAVSAMKNPIA